MNNQTNYEEYPTAALVMSAASCTLSIVGGIVIFATYALGTSSGIRNYPRQLLLYLTMADTMSAGGYLLSISRYTLDAATRQNISDYSTQFTESDRLCMYQSFVTTFSSLASFFWTVVIAAYMVLTVFYRNDSSSGHLAENDDRVTNRGKWDVLLHLVCWAIPGFITVTAVSYRALGQDKRLTAVTGPWCWISSEIDNEQTWMWITGKGWEIACYVVTTAFYVALKCYIRSYNRNTPMPNINNLFRDEDKNFLHVWWILLLLRIWGTIRFILNITLSPGNVTSSMKMVMKFLLYLQALGDTSQGFANFCLFCLGDKTVRREIRSCCSRCTPISDSYIQFD